MICPQCGKDNSKVQLVQDGMESRTKHKGMLYSIGRITLIVCTLGLWLLVPRQKESSKTKTRYHKEAICNECGCSWNI